MLEVEESQIDRLTETLYLLLNGKKAEPLVLPDNHTDDEISQFVGYFNRFIGEFDEFSDFMYSLSRGELEYEPPKGTLTILQSFKSLQANLKHLTWKTQQIAKGDFSHQVEFMGGFSIAFNDMTRQLKEAFEKINDQNRQLMEANGIIEQDRAKIDALLRNILPDKVVNELKANGSTVPQLYKNVTVYFSDIVGFTSHSAELEPAILIEELNSLFCQFDCIVESTMGERIKTIGDAYLAVWGMHNQVDRQNDKAVEAALKILDCIELRNRESKIQWQVRIGIHTGDVIGAVVGVSKFIYDIFGDTVNTANRLESSSEPMKVNVSETVRNQLSETFKIEERGVIHAKGKGDVKMFYISR